MKRYKILLLFLIASVSFLACQVFILRKHVSKQRIDMTGKEVKAEDSHRNIQDFTEVCKQYKLPVFLVDPDILQSIVDKKEYASHACKFLCTTEALTHLGTLAHLWTLKERWVLAMEHKGFEIIYFYARKKSDAAALDKNAAHYFFHRGTHHIHLVVFQKRPAGFWWHAALNPQTVSSRGGVQGRIEINLNLPYIKHAGAFEKVDIVDIKVDNIHIGAPRYPAQWLHQLSGSQFIECNQTQAELFYSLHGRDTSSRGFLFKKVARKVLYQATQVLDKLDMPYWLSSGTCLGWLRQCDIITHSKDVDIGVHIDDYNDKFIQEMQSTGFVLDHVFGKVSDSLQMSFIGEDVSLDVFFFYTEGDTVWNGGTQAKSGKKFKYLFPKFALCWTEFLDLKVRVPCETEKYIMANYGPNWFIPVKTWDWKTDPSNVHKNGYWPRKEWKDVIRHFN